MESNLNVVTSALHADALAIAAGELVRLAGTQLKLDADSLTEAASVVGRSEDRRAGSPCPPW